MKTLKNQIEMLKAIEKTMECNAKYRPSYFWHNHSSASSRRSNEKRFIGNYPDYIFRFKNDVYKVTHSYNETCAHCYYQLVVTKNGKITNITPLKTIFKKLTKVIECSYVDVEGDQKTRSYTVINKPVNEIQKKLVLAHRELAKKFYYEIDGSLVFAKCNDGYVIISESYKQFEKRVLQMQEMADNMDTLNNDY